MISRIGVPEIPSPLFYNISLSCAKFIRSIMLKIIFNFLLRFHGWTVDPVVPKETQHCVMIAAPHTSNWDFYYMKLAFYVLDVPMKFTVKREWTRFPFGIFMNPLGAVGVDRRPKVPGEKRKSLVDAMVGIIKSRDRIAMVIPPEGTRSLRKEWKIGFYYTAVKANVPITCGYLDFKNKRAGVAPFAVFPTGDIKKDLQPINEFYKDMKGKFPEKFSLDERYV